MAGLVSVIAVGVLALTFVSLILLVAFASASRHDRLGGQANSANERWARRVSGAYIRGDHEELVGR
ncbi:hypothetical protein GCM10009678_73810 [Actinomadura kijaniata]|uniref:Threonine/homoserine/homoserine lactone efflux protein n=1 Tax=Actinomadura namibiensis TaxID=182080 RepID=A0A7W3LPI0_ACTNM|nr:MULTISPECIES: hypothetical protein [Actinomadura]MBA8951905.1 threonine/homoserine/homoserine lactone efflux protein [Actinomadura namibiensis]